MGKLATKKASFKIIKTKAVVEMLSKKAAHGGTGDGQMEVKEKPFRWSPPIRYKFVSVKSSICALMWGARGGVYLWR